MRDRCVQKEEKLKKIILPLFICIVFCSCGEIRAHKAGSAEENYFCAVENYTNQNFGEARKYARRALEEDKSFFRAEILLGKISFFSKDFEGAKRTFLELTRKNPECTDAKLWLCRVLISTENFREAEKMLLEEANLNSRDWRVYYLLSLVSAGKGEMEKQLSYLEHAEIMLEESSSVYRDMGLLWQTLGVQDNALKYQMKYAYLFNSEK